MSRSINEPYKIGTVCGQYFCEGPWQTGIIHKTEIECQKECENLNAVWRTAISKRDVHLSHCNFGEYVGNCKYGDVQDCPAIQDHSWYGENLQKLEKLQDHHLVIDDLKRWAEELGYTRGSNTHGLDYITFIAHKINKKEEAFKRQILLNNDEMISLENTARIYKDLLYDREHAFDDLPHSTHSMTSLISNDTTEFLVELLPQTTLACTRREARDFINGGSIFVNGDRIDKDFILNIKDLKNPNYILLRRGKSTYHLTKWI